VKVTLDKTENRQAYLTVEMEQAEVEEGLKKAYNRLVQKYAVPGFRKGKAPRPILEQYLGKGALLDDAVEHMAPEAFDKAAEEQKIKAIARPNIELEKIDPVVYKMVVPLEPTVKLGDYKAVKVTQKSVELKEEDVTNAIEQLRHQHAVWEPADKAVEAADMINLDIESNVGEQPYINQKDAQYQVVKDADFPIKGFSEELIGLKKGETKEFKLSFSADYGRVELAGKEVAFKVSIKEIKIEKLPELNDDFAKKVNAEYTTLEVLKSKLKEGMQKNAEEAAKKEFEQSVMDEVVKISEVEYPPVMEAEEIEALVSQQMRRWQTDEKGMEEYLKSIQKTAEQFREDIKPVAIRSIKQSLVLTEIARAEGIKVEKDDLKGEIEGMVKDIEGERKQKLVELLSHPQNQVNIASQIATRKTVAKLTEIMNSSEKKEENTENSESK
jgi:trigger factor